jgi:superfamily II DNA or RNA helicase
MNLRDWQRQAFGVYREIVATDGRIVSWEATPGAGKTVGALSVVRDQREGHGRRRFVVIVPTRHLKRQWALAAQRFGIHLDTEYQFGQRLGREFQGVAITYQQVPHNAEALHDFTQDAMVVADEIHHAANGLAWGNGLHYGLSGAALVLSLSGTPFRSDDNRIPFLRYENNVSQPDYSYPYSQAIADRVCRPVAFFAYGGHVTWEEGGAVQYGSITADYDGFSRHLRVALEPGSGWLRPMIADAHEMLRLVRQEQPEAGGLVVALDQEHARRVAQLVAEVTGSEPVLALSDDRGSSRRISQFTNGREAWLVAVKMVSEGVDIPRLRVGVYATNVRTRMYFRQFLGRISRVTPQPEGPQVAYCYLPAEPTLMYLAHEVESEQRHVARTGHVLPPAVTVAQPIEDAGEGETAVSPDQPPKVKREDWQFRAARNELDALIVNGRQLPLLPDMAQAMARQEIQAQVAQRLAPLAAPMVEPETLSESKAALRREVKRLVGLYCQQSGRHFQEVYAQLNRQQRVNGQDQCTAVQLQERARIVREWL